MSDIWKQKLDVNINYWHLLQPWNFIGKKIIKLNCTSRPLGDIVLLSVTTEKARVRCHDNFQNKYFQSLDDVRHEVQYAIQISKETWMLKEHDFKVNKLLLFSMSLCDLGYVCAIFPSGWGLDHAVGLLSNFTAKGMKMMQHHCPLLETWINNYCGTNIHVKPNYQCHIC